LENTRANPIRKLQTSRYKISKRTKNVWINQKELLVAKNQEWYQEICLRMHQMLAEQSIAYEKSRRTSSTRNTRRILVEN